MFGWIKRLGRKQEVTAKSAPVVPDDIGRKIRVTQLKYQISVAKQRKKKHSHLAAELARLEKDSNQ